MATDLGKVGMRMRGDWSSSSTYEVMDVVSYNGGLYIAKQAVPANTLPTNTTYWMLGVKNTISQVTGYSLSDDSYATGLSSIKVYRCGQIILMAFSGQVNAIPNGTYGKLFKDLPPANINTFGQFFTNSSTPINLPVTISTSGELNVSSNNGYTQGWYAGSLVYLSNS